MINKRFRETRMKFNLTQKEFGQLLGLKSSDIKLIEAGRQKITPATLRVLKEKLSVDTDWLMNNISTTKR